MRVAFTLLTPKGRQPRSGEVIAESFSTRFRRSPDVKLSSLFPARSSALCGATWGVGGELRLQISPSPPSPPSTPATAHHDPHLHFAHGGRADFRGRDGLYYSFFSAPDFAVNVRIEVAMMMKPLHRRAPRCSLPVTGPLLPQLGGRIYAPRRQADGGWLFHHRGDLAAATPSPHHRVAG